MSILTYLLFATICCAGSFQLAAAQNQTGAPAESAPVGWQAAPGRRGTYDIIQTCLFTIFACTWTIQHLNVPRPGEHARKRIFRKCKWMLLTVFFPEFIMAHAIFELAMAVESMSEMSEMSKMSKTSKTSKIQVVEPPFWYAALRRILKHLGTELNEIKSGDSRGFSRSLVDWLCDGNEEVRPEPEWSLTHCYFANMGGFYHFGTEELAQPLTTGDLVRSKFSTP